MVTPFQQRLHLSIRLSRRDRLGETRHQQGFYPVSFGINSSFYEETGQ
jgi:hypothetical protein